MQSQLDHAARAPVSLAAPALDRFVEVPQVPRWAGRLIYVLVALIAAFAIWSALAKIDIIVRADGRLTAPTEQIRMQVYETSVVKSIDVRIGQQVKKGDRLAVLDPTFTDADRGDLQNQVAALSAAKARIQAEIDGVPYAPANPSASEQAQIRIYQQRQAERDSHVTSLTKKIAELKAQLAFAQSNAPLLAQQLELTRQLVEMNDELGAKGLALKRQVIEAKAKEVDALSKLNENKEEQIKLAEQMAAAQSDLDAYVSEWSRKLAEEYQKTSTDLDTAAAKLAKAARRSDLVAMTAPVDGSVLDIPQRSVGSVLREGETLLTLVPSDNAMPLDVAIASKDVAYLHVGQQVRIKFEALPYQEYGSAYGTLTALTADTTGDNPVSDERSTTDANGQSARDKRFYRARIRIDRTEMHNLPEGFQFRPGMKASADIKVGLRTVASYLLHPITRALDEGLHEQ